MALSRPAAAFAAEIRNHDWSDAPFRAGLRQVDGRYCRPGTWDTPG